MIVIWICLAAALFCLILLVAIGSAWLEAQTETDEGE